MRDDSPPTRRPEKDKLPSPHLYFVPLVSAKKVASLIFFLSTKVKSLCLHSNSDIYITVLEVKFYHIDILQSLLHSTSIYLFGGSR